MPVNSSTNANARKARRSKHPSTHSSNFTQPASSEIASTSPLYSPAQLPTPLPEEVLSASHSQRRATSPGSTVPGTVSKAMSVAGLGIDAGAFRTNAGTGTAINIHAHDYRHVHGEGGQGEGEDIAPTLITAELDEGREGGGHHEAFSAFRDVSLAPPISPPPQTTSPAHAQVDSPPPLPIPPRIYTRVGSPTPTQTQTRTRTRSGPEDEEFQHAIGGVRSREGIERSFANDAGFSSNNADVNAEYLSSPSQLVDIDDTGSGSLSRTIRAYTSGYAYPEEPQQQQGTFGSLNPNSNSYVPVPMVLHNPVREDEGGRTHGQTQAQSPGQGQARASRRQVQQQEFEREYEKEDDFGWGGNRGGIGAQGQRLKYGHGYGQQYGEEVGQRDRRSVVIDSEDDIDDGVGYLPSQPHPQRQQRGYQVPPRPASSSGSGLAQAMRRGRGGTSANSAPPTAAAGRADSHGYGQAQQAAVIGKEGLKDGKNIISWSRWGVLEGRRILTIAYHQRLSSSFSSSSISNSSHLSAAGPGPGLQMYDCTDLGSIKEILNIDLDSSFLSDAAALPLADGNISSGSGSKNTPKVQYRTKTRVIDVAVLPSSPLDEQAKETSDDDENPFIGILLESTLYAYKQTFDSSGVPSSPRPSVQDEFEFDFEHHYDQDRRTYLQQSMSTTKHHTTTLVVYSLRTHRIVRKISLSENGGRCVSGCRIVSSGNGRPGKEGMFGISMADPPMIRIFSSRTFEVVYSVGEEEIMGFRFGRHTQRPSAPISLAPGSVNLTTSSSPGEQRQQPYLSPAISITSRQTHLTSTQQRQQQHNRNFDTTFNNHNNHSINNFNDFNNNVLPPMTALSIDNNNHNDILHVMYDGKGEAGRMVEEGDEEEDILPYPVFAIHGRLLAYACVSPYGAGLAASSIGAVSAAPSSSSTISAAVSSATTSKDVKDIRRLSSSSSASQRSVGPGGTPSSYSSSGSGLSSALSGIGANALGGLGVAAGRLGSFASGLSMTAVSALSSSAFSPTSTAAGTRFVSRSAPDDGHAAGYLGLGVGVDREKDEKERVTSGSGGQGGVIKPSRSADGSGSGPGGGGGYYVRVLDLDVKKIDMKATKMRLRVRRISLFSASRSQPVSSLEFTKDGMSLGVGSRDGRWVKVFRIEVGPGVLSSSSISRVYPSEHTDPGSTEGENAIGFDQDQNLPAPTQTYELFRGHTNAHVHSTSFSSDGMYAGLATTNGTVHVFAVNPPHLGLGAGASGGVGDVKWHLDGRVKDIETLASSDDIPTRRKKATQVKALARLRTAKTTSSPSIAATSLNVNSLPSPPSISPVLPTSPFATERERSDKDAILINNIIPVAPLAFMFVSHADLASSPSLLPPSYSRSSSTYATSSSPSSAHPYGHRASSHSPSYSSSSAITTTTAGKNWQDVLIFDPSSGVLSLRRLWLDKRAVKGDALGLGGLSGIGNSLGGIGTSLGGIGNSLALGGISGISNNSSIGNSLAGIGSSLGGIGGGVVNAMTSISLPKMSSLSAYVGASSSASGSGSLYSPASMGYEDRTKGSHERGKERSELVASESVVAIWNLGRSSSRRGIKAEDGTIPVRRSVIPTSLARPTTHTARRTGSPADYLSHTEITTHYTPPSTLSSNSKTQTLKSLYLSHQFSFSSYTSSTAGDVDGEDYHALIRGYRFEALQGIGRKIEVRKEVEVVLAGGLGSPGGKGVVEEEEEDFVHGSAPRDIGHRRASSSSATSSAAIRSAFGLHMTSATKDATSDPLASAISSSLNDEGDYYTKTFGGRGSGLHQPQLPMWPNGAPGAYTTTTTSATSTAPIAGIVGRGSIRGVKGIGEGLGRIGKRLSASARSGRGPARSVGVDPVTGGKDEGTLEFDEFNFDEDEDEEQYHQQRYSQDEFEDDFLSMTEENAHAQEARRDMSSASAPRAPHRLTPGGPVPGPVPPTTRGLDVVDMDADVLGTVDEELWGSSSMTSIQDPIQPQHVQSYSNDEAQRDRVSWDIQDRQAVVEAEGYDDLEVEKAKELERVQAVSSLRLGSGGGGKKGKKGRR